MSAEYPPAHKLKAFIESGKDKAVFAHGIIALRIDDDLFVGEYTAGPNEEDDIYKGTLYSINGFKLTIEYVGNLVCEFDNEDDEKGRFLKHGPGVEYAEGIEYMYGIFKDGEIDEDSETTIKIDDVSYEGKVCIFSRSVLDGPDGLFELFDAFEMQLPPILEMASRINYGEYVAHHGQVKEYKGEHLVYEGNYSFGLRHGEGTIYCKDGSRIECKHANGTFVSGKEYNKDGELIHQGEPVLMFGRHAIESIDAPKRKSNAEPDEKSGKKSKSSASSAE